MLNTYFDSGEKVYEIEPIDNYFDYFKTGCRQGEQFNTFLLFNSGSSPDFNKYGSFQNFCDTIGISYDKENNNININLKDLYKQTRQKGLYLKPVFYKKGDYTLNSDSREIVGVIFTNEENIKKYFNKDITIEECEDELDKIFQKDIDLYNAWFDGRVYKINEYDYDGNELRHSDYLYDGHYGDDVKNIFGTEDMDFVCKDYDIFECLSFMDSIDYVIGCYNDEYFHYIDKYEKQERNVKKDDDLSMYFR